MIVKVEGMLLCTRLQKTKDGKAYQEIDMVQVGNGRRSTLMRIRAAADRKIDVLPGKPQVLSVAIEEREFQGRKFTTYDLAD